MSCTRCIRSKINSKFQELDSNHIKHNLKTGCFTVFIEWCVYMKIYMYNFVPIYKNLYSTQVYLQWNKLVYKVFISI